MTELFMYPVQKFIKKGMCSSLFMIAIRSFAIKQLLKQHILANKTAKRCAQLYCSRLYFSYVHICRILCKGHRNSLWKRSDFNPWYYNNLKVMHKILYIYKDSKKPVNADNTTFTGFLFAPKL